MKYQYDYEYSEKILDAQAIAKKLEVKKENKIAGLQKKLQTAGYVTSFNKKQEVNGNYLLLNYYNDVCGAYDALLSKRIDDKLELKSENLAMSKMRLEGKMTKVAAKKAKLDEQFKQI